MPRARRDRRRVHDGEAGEPRCFGGEHRPRRAEQPIAWHEEAAREGADREAQQRDRELLRQAPGRGDRIAEGGGEKGDARCHREPHEDRGVLGVFRSVRHGQQSPAAERRDRDRHEPETACDQGRVQSEASESPRIGDEVAREPGAHGHPQGEQRLISRDEEVGERREVAERGRVDAGLDGVARHVEGEAAETRDAPERQGDPGEAAQGAERQARSNGRQPDGSRQVVDREHASPAHRHRQGCEHEAPGQLEDDPDRQHAHGALGEHRDRDPPHVLRPLQEPEHELAHRLEGLGHRDREDQGEGGAAVAETEGHGGDGPEAEGGAQELHGEIHAEWVVLARIGGLQQPQVEVGERDDRRREREPESEEPHVGGGAELGDAGEDAPLAGAVAEIADERPGHVALQRPSALRRRRTRHRCGKRASDHG